MRRRRDRFSLPKLYYRSLYPSQIQTRSVYTKGIGGPSGKSTTISRFSQRVPTGEALRTSPQVPQVIMKARDMGLSRNLAAAAEPIFVAAPHRPECSPSPR